MKEIINMAIVLLCVAIGAVMVTGCATTQTGPSVCDTAPANSLLCKMAERTGQDLEQIGKTLRFANALAIGTGQYTIEEALYVARELKKTISVEGVTDINFQRALMKLSREHALVVMAALDLFNVGFDVGIPIPQWDLDRINVWLDETIMILGG